MWQIATRQKGGPSDRTSAASDSTSAACTSTASHTACQQIPQPSQTLTYKTEYGMQIAAMGLITLGNSRTTTGSVASGVPTLE